MKSRLYNRNEASEYLLHHFGIHAMPGTLAKYASLGGGPAFRKAGRFPVYEEADLDAWAVARLSKRVRSTSELAVRMVHSTDKKAGPRSQAVERETSNQ